MLSVGHDGQGVYAVVECDRPGCYGHVGVRPGWSGGTSYDLACEAFDYAESTGWRLVGLTYCPHHALERATRRPRVGDGHSWAWTRTEGVKGGQRPA